MELVQKRTKEVVFNWAGEVEPALLPGVVYED
jgi:hypothetical protein